MPTHHGTFYAPSTVLKTEGLTGAPALSCEFPSELAVRVYVDAEQRTCGDEYARSRRAPCRQSSAGPCLRTAEGESAVPLIPPHDARILGDPGRGHARGRRDLQDRQP